MSPDVRDNLYVVLCHPADVRNVAGAIRATVNSGLAGLRVVTEVDFDPQDLECYSSESMKHCDLTFYRTLDEALEDCQRVIGTSRRLRDPDAPPCWPAAGLALRLTGGRRTALLFGTERTGLTRPEIDRCEAVVWMPTSEVFPSMNLAHAVACMGYELARPSADEVGPPPVDPGDRTPSTAREKIYGFMEEVAGEISYPPGRNPEHFVRRLRRVLERANPSHAEFGLVAGMFSELKRLYGLSQKD